MTRRLHTGSTIVGLIVLTLGVLFLLDTTGAVHGVFSTWWPLLLILFGTSWTIQERGRGVFGPVAFLLGVGFLLENLDVLGEGWIGRYWPVAVIVAGLIIVYGALRIRSGGGGASPKPRANGDDWLDAVVLFSGRKERVRSKSWHGGRATAVMGGVELDLRDAAVPPEGAVLHVAAFMGGVEVTVPQTWEVSLRGLPLFGGFEDKTVHVDGEESEAHPHLEITGTVVFGGVEVKN